MAAEQNLLLRKMAANQNVKNLTDRRQFLFFYNIKETEIFLTGGMKRQKICDKKLTWAAIWQLIGR